MAADESIVRLRLSQMRLERLRQWGGCWLALQLWRELDLDEFWLERLLPSRKGTRWAEVLQILVVYRLLSPPSSTRPLRLSLVHAGRAWQHGTRKTLRVAALRSSILGLNSRIWISTSLRRMISPCRLARAPTVGAVRARKSGA